MSTVSQAVTILCLSHCTRCRLYAVSPSLHSTAHHSTSHHSTSHHITAQHITSQHSTAQHSTAHHSTAQHSTSQHSTAQHSTAQGHLEQDSSPLWVQYTACAHTHARRDGGSQQRVADTQILRLQLTDLLCQLLYSLQRRHQRCVHGRQHLRSHCRLHANHWCTRYVQPEPTTE